MHISKIKNAIKEVERIAESSLESGTMIHISQTLRSLENELLINSSKIDVLILGNELGKEILIPADKIEEWSNSYFVSFKLHDFECRVFNPDKFPIVRIDQLPPIIKLVYINDSNLEVEELTYFVNRLANHTAFLYFVIGPDAPQVSSNIFNLEKVWKEQKLSQEEFNSLDSFLSKLSNSLKKSSTYVSSIFGLKKISEFLEIQMQNEQKDLDAKKIAVSKELETNKRSANSKSAQEVFAQIKNNLNKSASEFEKGIGERFGKITKVQDGSLFYTIEEEIGLLKELEEEEVDGEIHLRLPDSVSELLDWMQQELKDHLSNDVISLNDFLMASMEEVKDLLSKAGVNSANLKIDMYDKSKIEPLLEHSLRMEKDFEAKGVSKNFNTVFSAIRQPIFMVMSILMIAGFAGFNQQVQIIKENFSVLIIALLAFGTYQAFHNIAVDKRRKMKEETKKAKQYLSTELRRILTSVEREWKQPYNDFLKKQIREIIDDCENELKNYSQKLNQEINDKNLLTQRKMLNINNQEKTFQGAIREKQNFDNKLNNLLLETKIESQKILNS